MSVDRLQESVPDGEALRYQGSLRTGGAVGLTDERLLVAEDEVRSVDLRSVHSVEIEDFDWFVGLLSVGLVGFGLYSTTINLFAGVAFALAGAGSLYLSYRKRGKASVRVRGRAKPLVLYPSDLDEFQTDFEAALDRYQERLDAQAAATEPEDSGKPMG